MNRFEMTALVKAAGYPSTTQRTHWVPEDNELYLQFSLYDDMFAAKALIRVVEGQHPRLVTKMGHLYTLVFKFPAQEGLTP